MTSPWMPEFYRDPGPPGKQGYWFQNSRTQAETEGAIYHDSVGGLQGTLNVLHGSVLVSWTATIDVKPIIVNGKSYLGKQHYPLWGEGSITFHAGIVGDLDDDTAVVGNLALGGFEFCRPAGNIAAKWTDFQVEAAAYTFNYIDRPEVFELARNAWEHNWLKNTACPSNRNRWTEMEQALEPAPVPVPPPEPIKEEDDMYILGDRSGKRWILQGDGRKRPITNEQLESYAAVGIPGVNLTPAQVKAIPDVTNDPTGDGGHAHGGTG